MDGFAGMVAAIATGLVVAGIVWAAHRMSAVGGRAEVPAFLSGEIPSEHALSRFHVRWYPVTLLFLAFDVEMLFMYPWALVVASMGGAAVTEMFIFLALLMAGVVYAWREGALRWT